MNGTGTASFDVMNLDLDYTEKPYLIEASAGTGKTFSIASLVLRIFLENESADIKKILILTFTNAATNELRMRVRKFLNDAWNYLENGDDSVDEVIKAIVDKSSNKGIDKIKNALRLAMLDTDEAPIYTIHSFCQRMLSDFAFETGMSLDFDVIPDESSVVKNVLLKFWREKVNTSGAKYDIKEMLNLMSEFFIGKKEYSIQNLWDLLSSSVYKHLSGKELVVPEEYNGNLLFEMLEEANVFVEENIKDFKKKYGLISYNDMIKMLHDSVEDEQLSEKIREKFDYVFVDEFQDTDNLQYEIFSKVFENKIPVFYIGDPKQSIYGFRGADIYTYKEAKKGAKVLQMKTNFRSSKELINDLNEIFGLLKGRNEELNFDYSNVEAKQNFDFNVDGEKRGIYVYKVENEKGYASKDMLKNTTPEVVKYLVSKGEIADENDQNNKRKIKYSDIAVIVRSNSDAKDLKAKLSAESIPAVIIDETPVLKTDEAKELFFVLEAVLFPSDININSALATKLIGNIDYETIKKAEKDKFAELFSQVKEVWLENGVFPAIIKFMSLFGVWKNGAGESIVDRERIITNVLHISEILNDKEINSRYGMYDLLSWFAKAINNDDEAYKDGYELRMESDRSAIKIVTVHKSKGLEYPVVLLPMMNIRNEIKFSYYNPGTGEHYYNFIIDFYDSGKWKYTLFRNNTYYLNKAETELEKENLRLFYVAMTRAKYFNFIFSYVNWDDRKISRGLFRFFEDFFHNNEFDVDFTGVDNAQETDDEDKVVIKEFKGEINQTWGVTSYSALEEHDAEHLLVKASDENDELTGYGRFIFKDMAKGAIAGNVLHKILEITDFSNVDELPADDAFEEKLNGFAKTLNLNGDNVTENFFEFIRNVVGAEYPDGIRLNRLQKTFKELEFYFSFETAVPDRINSLFEKYGINAKIGEEQVTKGVIHGFADMVFEYGGKVYILDWKSNYLGDRLENYNDEAMKEAMDTNNYHLQYYLYSLALFRYMGQKRFEKDFGGVIYVFLRGVRKDKKTGIWFVKPDIALINELDNILRLQET